MFVAGEVLLDVSFDAARARVVTVACGGSLMNASRHAYGHGIAGLARVGPLGYGAGMSRLVRVHYRDPVTRGGCVVLTLRWEATGPGGVLFPALDADITLTPAGEQASLLRLDGAYRPPLGALGAELDKAILHRVATATIQAFISRIGDAIAHPAAAAGRQRGQEGPEPAWPPPALQMP